MILAIYGAGGLGREILELARIINGEGNRWTGYLFVDDDSSKDVVQDVKVMSFEQIRSLYGTDEVEYTIAVGEPSTRRLLFDKLESYSCRIATLVHPDVHIPDTTIVGRGVIISYGCFVSCNVTLGENVILQPNANVGHDDVIGAHSVISTTAALGGACVLGEQAYVGLGVSIRELLNIGTNAVVGMGAVVMRDVEADAIVAGNPARKMLNNTDHKVFHH